MNIAFLTDSNFRFFPETLLSDVLPRNVENALLAFHNELAAYTRDHLCLSAPSPRIPCSHYTQGSSHGIAEVHRFLETPGPTAHLRMSSVVCTVGR